MLQTIANEQTHERLQHISVALREVLVKYGVTNVASSLCIDAHLPRTVEEQVSEAVGVC